MITYYLKDGRLKSIRNQAGLTQKELADRMGVSQANIVRMEKNPSSVSLGQVDEWVKICRPLTIPYIDFLSQSEKVPVDDLQKLRHIACEIFASSGAELNIKIKPLVTVIPEYLGQVGVVSSFISEMLYSGDQSFSGYFMPSAGRTILFRHISEMPLGASSTTYIFDVTLTELNISVGGGSILDFTGGRSGSIIDQGGISILEQAKKQEVESAICFVDHPFVRTSDIVLLSADFESDQGVHDLRLIQEADVCVSVLEEHPVPHLNTCLSLILKRTIPEVVVTTSKVRAETVRRAFSGVGGDEPLVYTVLSKEDALENEDVLTKILKRTIESDMGIRRNIRNIYMQGGSDAEQYVQENIAWSRELLEKNAFPGVLGYLTEISSFAFKMAGKTGQAEHMRDALSILFSSNKSAPISIDLPARKYEPLLYDLKKRLESSIRERVSDENGDNKSQHELAEILSQIRGMLV